MIGSAVSLLANVAGLHSWFTGIRSGQINENLLQETTEMRRSIERLTEHIVYAQSISEVRDTTKKRQDILDSKKELCDLLSPIQRGLGEDILTTAVVLTPEKLRKAITKDPWEVLVEIRPAERAKKPANPDLVPIIFNDNSSIYIGWQTRGAFPMLFDCEYTPDAGLYLPFQDVRLPTTAKLANDRETSKAGEKALLTGNMVQSLSHSREQDLLTDEGPTGQIRNSLETKGKKNIRRTEDPLKSEESKHTTLSSQIANISNLTKRFSVAIENTLEKAWSGKFTFFLSLTQFFSLLFLFYSTTLLVVLWPPREFRQWPFIAGFFLLALSSAYYFYISQKAYRSVKRAGENSSEPN